MLGKCKCKQLHLHNFDMLCKNYFKRKVEPKNETNKIPQQANLDFICMKGVTNMHFS